MSLRWLADFLDPDQPDPINPGQLRAETHAHLVRLFPEQMHGVKGCPAVLVERAIAQLEAELGEDQ